MSSVLLSRSARGAARPSVSNDSERPAMCSHANLFNVM